MERAYVDTNVLLRFLTGDPEELAQRARLLFQAVDSGRVRLVLEDAVLAELVWVLESFYGQPADQVTRTLLDLLVHDGIECRDKGLLVQALVLHADQRVDFADALVAAAMQQGGQKVIYSFDRHFDPLPGITRREPGEAES